MNKEQLIKNIRKKSSFLCVGLDPDIKRIPTYLQNEKDSLFTFNKAIIDATASYCVAYKPNLAFYECYGLPGWKAFEKTVFYIKTQYPDHFIIADAKRGDIGNTSAMYAKSLFEELDVDAITVAPYMGEDSISPFLQYKHKWVILLGLTSNRGSSDFQLQKMADGNLLYEKVIKSSLSWSDSNHLMYVIGATQGKLFGDIRRIIPNHFLLVPGVGVQGGSLQEVCKYGLTKNCGLLINSSRSIIYADSSQNFAKIAGEKAHELQIEMAKILNTI